MQSLAVGIDLGGTQLRAALVDEAGNILKRNAVLTDAMGGPDKVVIQMENLVNWLLVEINPVLVVGIGVSAPGPLDAKQGVALNIPTLAGFVDYPLTATLRQRFRYPVNLENDGIAAALGEWRFGAGRGVENMVYVTVSTGIGGGVVVDNHMLHGRRGMAGHVGHMSIALNGELCPCGNQGCFEAYGSGTAFAKRAGRKAFTCETTELGTKGMLIDSRAVFEAARNGDRLATELIEEEAEILGRGFTSLLHLFSPELLVMGGGLSNEFDTLKPGIDAYISRWAMPAFRDVKIVRSALGQNSGLVGSAALAFAHSRTSDFPI